MMCDEIDYQPVTDALEWCKDYNLADECDLFDQWAESTIEDEMAITFMRAYGREFKLNFFTDAARSNENLPLALVVHGGGFNSGSRNNCKIIESAREFAARGYRTIAIDYPMCGAYWKTVSPDEPVPTFDGSGQRGGWYDWDADTPLYPLGQQDPQCQFGGASSNTHPEQYAQAAEVANRAGRYAIQFAHSKADEWKIDIDRTVCHGSSAGAITCNEMFLFNTTVRHKPEVTGLSIKPELDQYKIDVAAGRAGGLLGIRPVTQETVDAMATNAAMYNLHGTEDDVVPVTAAEFLVDEMEMYGVPAELVLAEGEGHSLFYYQFNQSHPERLDDMFEFIERYVRSGGVRSGGVKTGGIASWRFVIAILIIVGVALPEGVM